MLKRGKQIKFQGLDLEKLYDIILVKFLYPITFDEQIKSKLSRGLSSWNEERLNLLNALKQNGPKYFEGIIIPADEGCGGEGGAAGEEVSTNSIQLSNFNYSINNEGKSILKYGVSRGPSRETKYYETELKIVTGDLKAIIDLSTQIFGQTVLSEAKKIELGEIMVENNLREIFFGVLEGADIDRFDKIIEPDSRVLSLKDYRRKFQEIADEIEKYKNSTVNDIIRDLKEQIALIAQDEAELREGIDAYSEQLRKAVKELTVALIIIYLITIYKRDDIIHQFII